MISNTFFNRPKDALKVLRQMRAVKQPILAPLFEAVAGGKLALFIWSERLTEPPLADLSNAGQAVVILVDDALPPPGGPDAWLGWQAVVEWAGSGVYPYAGPQPAELFRIAVEEAALRRRFLLIETEPATLNAWLRAVGGRAVRVREVGLE